MCAIVGSYSIDTFDILMTRNTYRGAYSNSYFMIDRRDFAILRYKKSLGGYNEDTFTELQNIYMNLPEQTFTYIIGHVQAPTTISSSIDKTTHPAVLNENYLWHNGLIKQSVIKKMSKELFKKTKDESWKKEKWDTKLLLGYLVNKMKIDDIDGSFACVWLHDYKINVFRNDISPLFVNHDGDISSTEFDESKSLEPNVMFNFDLRHKAFDKEYTFTTKDNPYVIL